MPREKETLYYFAKIALGNLLLFFLIYPATNHATNAALGVHKIYFEWERNIPLVDWMILPYLSFNLLFLVPLLALTRDEMQKLGVAFSITTLCAGMTFFLFPMHFGFDRIIPNGYFAQWYQNLYALDMPTNLVPSLHVAYSTLFFLSCMKVIRNKTLRMIFGLWIATTIVSTLFTHQHHIIDVLTGAALAMSVYFFVSNKLYRGVHQYRVSGLAQVQSLDASPPKD